MAKGGDVLQLGT